MERTIYLEKKLDRSSHNFCQEVRDFVAEIEKLVGRDNLESLLIKDGIKELLDYPLDGSADDMLVDVLIEDLGGILPAECTHWWDIGGKEYCAVGIWIATPKSEDDLRAFLKNVGWEADGLRKIA